MDLNPQPSSLGADALPLCWNPNNARSDQLLLHWNQTIRAPRFHRRQTEKGQSLPFDGVSFRGRGFNLTFPPNILLFSPLRMSSFFVFF